MSTVELQLDEATGIASLWLNRPEAANAIDVTLAVDFGGAVDELVEWGKARAVLIRGRGKMFCGGGDVKSFAADPAAGVADVLAAWHPAVEALNAVEAPIIAGVHGSAAGAGFGLAGACDLVVATRSARFVPAYTAIGLSPDGSSSWFIPRLIGHHRAAELFLLNRPLGAEEAQSWGLVNIVVDDDALDAESEALALRLAAGPTVAYASVRKLLHGTWTATLSQQLEAERRGMADAAATSDAREGIAALIERRPAVFTGE